MVHAGGGIRTRGSIRERPTPEHVVAGHVTRPRDGGVAVAPLAPHPCGRGDSKYADTNLLDLRLNH